MNRFIYILVSLIFIIISQDDCEAGHNYQSPEDSIMSSFEKFHGKKRIKTIAEFIRFADLNYFDYKNFEPYLAETYAWEKVNEDVNLLNVIRLGDVNLSIAGGNEIKAIRLLHEILQSQMPISSEDSVSTYTFLYNLYKDKKNYSKAWEYLQVRDRVLDHNKKVSPFFEDFERERFVGLALAYYNMKEYDKAINQQKKLIEQVYSKKDHHREAGAWNNMGLCWLDLQQPDSALFCFRKARDCWHKKLASVSIITHSDSLFFVVLDANMAVAYNRKQQFKKAVPILINYVSIFKRISDENRVVSGLIELGRSFLGLQDYKKAIKYLNEASEILKGDSSLNGYEENLRVRIEVLEQSKNIEDAYFYYKKWVAYTDSISKVENKSRAKLLEIEYEIDSKNNEINRQKLMLSQAKISSEKQKGLHRTLVLGILLMLIIVLILIGNSMQRKKRTANLHAKNKQIEQQKQIIEKSLGEKETLLKEIHHRVKNNLQLINGIFELQAAKSDDNKVKEIIEEGQNRVRTMALIHQQLYQNEDLRIINFQEYLDKLVNDIAIASNKPGQKIGITINANNLSFDVNTSISLGLIVNELVTNTFKHGFKDRTLGEIVVSIKDLKQDGYELTVKDNGKGLPVNFDPHSSKSLGLRLVDGLSRQLDGSYLFIPCESSGKTGAHFVVRFETAN